MPDISDIYHTYDLTTVHAGLLGSNMSTSCRSVELAKDTYLSSAFAGWITGMWCLASTEHDTRSAGVLSSL